MGTRGSLDLNTQRTECQIKQVVGLTLVLNFVREFNLLTLKETNEKPIFRQTEHRGRQITHLLKYLQRLKSVVVDFGSIPTSSVVPTHHCTQSRIHTNEKFNTITNPFIGLLIITKFIIIVLQSVVFCFLSRIIYESVLSV